APHFAEFLPGVPRGRAHAEIERRLLPLAWTIEESEHRIVEILPEFGQLSGEHAGRLNQPFLGTLLRSSPERIHPAESGLAVHLKFRGAGEDEAWEAALLEREIEGVQHAGRRCQPFPALCGEVQIAAGRRAVPEAIAGGEARALHHVILCAAEDVAEQQVLSVQQSHVKRLEGEVFRKLRGGGNPSQYVRASVRAPAVIPRAASLHGKRFFSHPGYAAEAPLLLIMMAAGLCRSAVGLEPGIRRLNRVIA